MKDEPGRGADDAKLFILNSLHEHLEQKSTYVRLFCVDFSSVFNTMQPHTLIKKLRSYFHLDQRSLTGGPRSRYGPRSCPIRTPGPTAKTEGYDLKPDGALLF